MGICCSKIGWQKQHPGFDGNFLDFEEIIKNHALKVYQKDRGDRKARVENFDFKIIDDKLDYVTEQPWYKPLAHLGPDGRESDKVSLFTKAESTFDNKSELEQTYTFEQEKTTRSTVNIRLKKGVKLLRGVNLHVEKEIYGSGQGIPKTVHISGAVNQEMEESVKWSVSHPVRVPKWKSAKATLCIVEEEKKVIFSIKTTLSGKLKVVMTKRSKSGNQGRQKTIWMDVYEVFQPYVAAGNRNYVTYLSNQPDDQENDSGSVVMNLEPNSKSKYRKLQFTTAGQIQFTYAVKQMITIDENIDLPK